MTAPALARPTRRAVVSGALLAAGGAIARPRVDIPAPPLPGDIAGYGAVSDGTADDSGAVSEAAADGPVTFRAGTTRIATALTIEAPVTILPGAAIRVDRVTLTLNGPFSASVTRVFDCVNGGRVLLGPRTCPAAHAEWWGAVGDGAIDCTAAINAALRGHGVVQLLSGSYRTTDSIRLDDSEMTLKGASRTRTVIRHETAGRDIVTISPAPETKLAGPGNRYFSNIALSDLDLTRIVEPHQPTPEPSPGWACGVRVSNALRVNLARIFDQGNALSYHVRHTINVFADECYSSRAMTIASQRYVAWWLDCGTNPDVIGISPNASTRLKNCIVSTAGPGVSTGLYMNGHYSDQFLDEFETAGTDYGIVIDGMGSNDRYKVDVTIRNPILDGFKRSGLVVRNSLSHSLISVIGGYAAPSAAATGPLVEMTASWNVTLGGGFQFVGWPCPTATGLRASGCRQVTVDKATKIQDCRQPVDLQDCYTSDISPNVTATDRRSADQAAIVLRNSARIKVEARIDGAAPGCFRHGVSIEDAPGGRSGFIEVNGTGINLGPVANKILDRGQPVIAAGPFGYHNLASGIMN